MTPIFHSATRITLLALLVIVSLLVATHGVPTLGLALSEDCRCASMDHCHKAGERGTGHSHAAGPAHRCHARPGRCELHASGCSAAHGIAGLSTVDPLVFISTLARPAIGDRSSLVLRPAPRPETLAFPPPDPPPVQTPLS